MSIYQEMGLEHLRQLDRVAELIDDPQSIVVVGFNQTLFDTSPYRLPLLQEAASELGLTCEMVLSRGNGLRHNLGLAIYISQGGDSPMFDVAEQALLDQEESLQEILDDEQDLSDLMMPGVDSLVRHLRNAGKKAQIATDSRYDFVKAFLQKSIVDGQSVDDVFSSRILSGETSKRASGVAQLQSTRKNQLSMPRSIVIGDNWTDAELAAGTGSTALIVNPDDTGRTRIIKGFGADKNICIVGSLREVFNDD